MEEPPEVTPIHGIMVGDVEIPLSILLCRDKCKGDGRCTRILSDIFGGDFFFDGATEISCHELPAIKSICWEKDIAVGYIISSDFNSP
jgi:hypothetical protein